MWNSEMNANQDCISDDSDQHPMHKSPADPFRKQIWPQSATNSLCNCSKRG